MSTPQNTIDIQKLSRDERILLAEQLWDSLADLADTLPVTAAQKNILNERLARYHTSPHEGFTWDEIKGEMK